MASARSIIDGEPGTRWENDTEKVMYQFRVSGFHTCAICYQYMNKIARFWPLPIHHSCRCKQLLIKPGALAPHEFIDYRRVVAKLPKHEQVMVMGASNYTLVQSGVVKWSDVVTPSRIRSLREVLDLHHISAERAIEAGVTPGIARQAKLATSTPEHIHAERHRQELEERLRQAGMHANTLIDALSRGLASRASIAEGPSYTARSGAVLAGIQADTLVKPESHAAELGALLAMTAAERHRLTEKTRKAIEKRKKEAENVTAQ